MDVTRVFKKSSPNGKLTLYLSSRDLVVSAGKIDRLQGVLLVDPEFVDSHKVYGQITLTFRYGREDEEVMGLKFCNEAIMCLAQLYPPHPGSQPPEGNSVLQEALLKRLGANAFPFSMEITPLAPPSVQLVPAKEYHGDPIGTSYDMRAFIGNRIHDCSFRALMQTIVADRADEKLNRRSTVRMGIRVVQRAFAPPSPYFYNIKGARSKDGKAAKKSLFGCKSVPLEMKFAKTPRNKSKSIEAGLEQVRLDTESLHGTQMILANHQKDMRGEMELVGREQGIDRNLQRLTKASLTDISQNSIDDQENVCLKRSSTLVQLQKDNSNDSDNEETTKTNFKSSCASKRASLAAYLAELPAPKATIEKPFLLSDGRVHLCASLDKAVYSHGEEILVLIDIKNDSNKTIRRIKIFIVQHVDVCMFSNGKFKNVVAAINHKEGCPVAANTTYSETFALLPTKSTTKNWIALEDSYTKAGTTLASTISCLSTNPDERNVFAIYVSYYAKVKLCLSGMGGEISLKLPFTLMHTCSDGDTDIRTPRSHLELELKAGVGGDEPPPPPPDEGT